MAEQNQEALHPIADRRTEIKRQLGNNASDSRRCVRVRTDWGKLFLSQGGYVAEAKKSKNAVIALHISITAIIISLIALFR